MPQADIDIPESPDSALIAACREWFEQTKIINEAAPVAAAQDTYPNARLTELVAEIVVARNILRLIAGLPAATTEGYRSKLLVCHALLAGDESPDSEFIRRCLSEFICRFAPTQQVQP